MIITVFKSTILNKAMNIHICQSVEFEKVKDWLGAIPLTRKRLSIQQLLDSGELEDDNLDVQLEQYIVDFDSATQLLARERHVPLDAVPCFSWNVQGHQIDSPCWKTEAILSRLTLAELYLTRGRSQLPDYKKASSTFASAIQVHQQMMYQLDSWKWKMSDHNQFFFQKEWHRSRVSQLECLRHLAMVSVGLGKSLADKTLYTVAQRGVAAATASIAQWPNTAHQLLPLCEYMRYYFSSNMLWENGQYGASLHRMEQWLKNKPEPSLFENINNEIDKVDFLLEERQRTNNGAYFDPVEASTPLATPVELLEKVDIVIKTNV
jgi:hypothetical protein